MGNEIMDILNNLESLDVRDSARGRARDALGREVSYRPPVYPSSGRNWTSNPNAGGIEVAFQPGADPNELIRAGAPSWMVNRVRQWRNEADKRQALDLAMQAAKAKIEQTKAKTKAKTVETLGQRQAVVTPHQEILPLKVTDVDKQRLGVLKATLNSAIDADERANAQKDVNEILKKYETPSKPVNRIYRWTDETGTVHTTDDIRNVTKTHKTENDNAWLKDFAGRPKAQQQEVIAKLTAIVSDARYPQDARARANALRRLALKHLSAHKVRPIAQTIKQATGRNAGPGDYLGPQVMNSLNEGIDNVGDLIAEAPSGPALTRSYVNNLSKQYGNTNAPFPRIRKWLHRRTH